ncbi:hypothetical protein [Orientia tsutsugamushi]|nr:hypothetical protein [Orientia tsutsugamushi]
MASIERGVMFEMLSNIFGSHVLTDIRRKVKTGAEKQQ